MWEITHAARNTWALALALLAISLKPYGFMLKCFLLWMRVLASTARTIKHELMHRSIHDIPGPIPFPIIGTQWIYNKYLGKYKISKVHEAYESMFSEYGQVFREEAFLNYPVIHICSSDDIKTISTATTLYPIRPPIGIVCHFRKEKTEWYKDSGITNLQGKEWHTLRSNTTADLFKLRVIRNLLPELNDIALAYTQELDKMRNPDTGRVQDIIELNRKLGFESTCLLGIGLRAGLLEDELDPRAKKLSEATNSFFEALNTDSFSLPLWKWKLFNNKFYKPSNYVKLCKAETDLYEVISEYLEETKLRISESSDQPSAIDVIPRNIINNTNLDQRVKNSSIADFVSAGMNTVGNTLSLLLYHIAKTPDVQKNLYKEICNELQPNEDITPGFLKKAKYLDACLKEYYRMTPTAPHIARILDQDRTLSGYHVPKGTAILCHTRIACKNWRYFSEPDKFIPERWTDNKRQEHGHLVCPFGFQRRICPGQQFSEQTLKVFVTSVNTHF
ncbi:Hypothetical predicted protein [Cloeon dipterum]|uniref:Cytochrome P450 n=1 Tax=Cloeon dipterum TaxID=197152 RepID=A0A8S1C0T3_9INSE|nr:Hypothetical predicted protein [Cloeon dipterum]